MSENVTLVCLACQVPDPPPEMTCPLGRDHRVGLASGCPACGRLAAACARRPCAAKRRSRLDPSQDGYDDTDTGQPAPLG